MTHKAITVTTPSWGKRLPGMEGLRALAMIAVLTAHTWQESGAGMHDFGSAWKWVQPLADSGLTLFFTLSGFLLYRPFAAAVLRQADAPRTSAYLRNRALRIVPAYWVILLATAVFSAVSQPVNPARAGGFDSVHSAILNIFLLQTYTPHTVQTGIAPAWSLSVEVVFYFALPLLALVAARLAAGRGTRGRFIAVCVPAALLLLLGLAGKVIYHKWIGVVTNESSWKGVFHLSFLSKSDLFAWGMLAAVIMSASDTERLARMPVRRLGAFGAAAVVFGTIGKQTPMIALGCGLVLLWVGVAYARGPARLSPARALETRPVVFLGLISYSAYLWHWPVMLWLKDHGFMTHGWTGVFANLALVAGLTIALSALTYRFVERPAMARKARMTRRPTPDVVAVEAATMEAAP